MTAYVLTIVLFLANADPVAVVAIFEDRPACGTTETDLINKAMGEQSVIGFDLLNDCKPVKAANKV